MSLGNNSDQSVATVDAGKNLDVSKTNSRTATVLLRNTGAKSAKIQLQGSINGTDFVNIGSEETVASGANKVLSVTDYWPHLRAVCKPAAEGQQTTVHFEVATIDD